MIRRLVGWGAWSDCVVLRKLKESTEWDSSHASTGSTKSDGKVEGFTWLIRIHYAKFIHTILASEEVDLLCFHKANMTFEMHLQKKNKKKKGKLIFPIWAGGIYDALLRFQFWFF